MTKSLDWKKPPRLVGKILFVTKTIEARFREVYKKCYTSYITERWYGGMLTNFVTITKIKLKSLI